MAMAVETANADPLAFIARVFEIVAVGLVVGRDQTLTFGDGLRLFDQFSLFLVRMGISRSRPPLVHESFSMRRSPRSAQAGTILIDSSRRRPNSTWKQSDM